MATDCIKLQNWKIEDDDNKNNNKTPTSRLKILAKKRLQSAAEILLDPEQACMKGRTIQSNQHLFRTILEDVKYDDKIALIISDQSKVFDRADHQYLAAVRYCVPVLRYR